MGIEGKGNFDQEHPLGAPFEIKTWRLSSEVIFSPDDFGLCCVCGGPTGWRDALFNWPICSTGCAAVMELARRSAHEHETAARKQTPSGSTKKPCGGCP
jgi:hypothetical protein